MSIHGLQIDATATICKIPPVFASGISAAEGFLKRPHDYQHKVLLHSNWLKVLSSDTKLLM